MTTDKSNGHRPEFQDVTLPDCGLALRIKRVSPFLAKDIRKKIKQEVARPNPPEQLVDYGDGNKKFEPNVTHPDYKAALNDYFAEVGDLMLSELIAFGVECDYDAKAVAAFRAKAKGRGLELPADDLLVYVTRVVGLSQADVRALQDAILGRIQPTESAVKEAAESFPSPV